MAIPVFAHISAASNLIPAAVGVKNFRNLQKGMRFLALLCVLACLQLVGELVVGYVYKNNYFLADYYNLAELTLLGAVFYFSTKSKASRVILGLLFAGFLAYWLVDMIHKTNPEYINSNLAMVSRVFLIAMSLVGFQNALAGGTAAMSRVPVFWVSFAVVLYSAGTLLLFGLSNQLLAMGVVYFEIAWYINWVLLIVVNVMYSKGMLCRETA